MTRFYIWKSLDSRTIHAIWGEFRFVGIDVPPKIIEVKILSMFCEIRENIKIQFLQWNRPATTTKQTKKRNDGPKSRTLRRLKHWKTEWKAFINAYDVDFSL